MAIRVYNKDTLKWEKVASLLAPSIEVLDFENNFTEKNVEGCLREISNSIQGKIDDVTLDEENGLNFYSDGTLVSRVVIPSVGGVSRAICGEFLVGELPVGYGVGQSELNTDIDFVWVDNVTPVNAENMNRIESKIKELKITVDEMGSNTPPEVSSSHNKLSYKPGESVKISYYLFDAEGGTFIANYSINGKVIEVEVNAGNNIWDIGVLPNGLYNLVLTVKDKKLTSRPLIWEIEVGGLELTSNFRSDTDFELGKDIVVPYVLKQLSAKEVNIDLTIDGNTQTIKSYGGVKTWRIQGLAIGVHTISIKAYDLSNGNESNTLSWQIAVTNSTSLFIMSDMASPIEISSDESLVIPYRVSMQGYDKFKVRYTIDGDVITGNAIIGMNSFPVGLLPIGSHQVTIQVLSPIEGLVDSNVLTFDINVSASDFSLAEPIQDNMLFWFNAGKKDNSFDNKHTWEDLSGNNVNVIFKNLNYVTNGWINGWLELNGDCYAYIDLAPFLNDVSRYGMTFDVRFKYVELGNPNAKVISCKQPIPPYNGFAVDTKWGYMSGSGLSGTVPVIEKEDIRMTFVIDRQKGHLVTYLNGVACNYTLISGTPNFSHNSKIYLNCDISEGGVVQNLSECSIKEIIGYDRALSSDEVLQNYQSGLSIQEQKELIARNIFLTPEEEELSGKKSTLPRIDIDGSFDGMGAEIQRPMKVSFDPKVTGYQMLEDVSTMVDHQGSSSLIYTIKNYNFDMYTDETYQVEYDVSMRNDWYDYNSYHIKANFIDSSHSYNLGFVNHLPKCYKEETMGMILEKQKPIEEQRPIRYGVDGFPCIMYQNGKPHGLYTWNLKNHRNVIGTDRAKPEQQMFRCESNTGLTAKFRDWQDLDNMKVEWEEREPRTGNYSDLQALIKWVMTSTDEEFVRDLEQHFNKEFLITYYILMISCGAVDNTCKNLLLTTWNKGSQGHSIWYPMWYDVDTLFGCDNQGNYKRWTPQVEFPKDYNAPDQLLWLRVQQLLWTDIEKRYLELRDVALTVESLKETLVDTIVGKIGERYYNWDAEVKYLPTKSSEDLMKLGGNKLLWTLKWFKERLTYCDDLFNYEGKSEKRIIFRSYTGGIIKIGIQTIIPTRITVSFSDKIESAKITKKCSPDDITYFEWDYKGDNALHICNITNGDLIQRITGFNDADLDSLVLEHCERLLELECKNNPRLPTLTFQNSPRLTKVDISGCVGIKGTLDFSSSRSLRYLNVSNTGVSTLVLTNALYLEELDITNSKIVQLTLDNQQNINSINASGCSELTTLSLNNCPKITDLNLTNLTSLTNLFLRGCANLKTLDIHGNTRLSQLDIRECPLIYSLDVSNTYLAQLDLGGITTTITKFNVSNTPMKDILGLNFYIKNDEDLSMFRGCYALERIIGYIRVGGTKGDRLFKGLVKLVTPPIVEIDNTVVSIEEMFMDCNSLITIPVSKWSINCNNIVGVFNGCSSVSTLDLSSWNTSNVTDMSYIFNGCRNLTTSPNFNYSSVLKMNNIFNGCSNLTTLDFNNLQHELVEYENLVSGCEKVNTINFTGKTSRVSAKSLIKQLSNVVSTLGDVNNLALKINQTEEHNEVQDEEIVSNMMGTIELYEMVLAMTTMAMTANEDNGRVANKMVELYVILILKGKKTINDVPVVIRPQVEAELKELGVM